MSPLSTISIVGGAAIVRFRLKQGWAFSWRSLLAGELLVTVPGVVSLGGDMSNARNNGQAELPLALMIVILVIAMIVASIFSALAQHVRPRGHRVGDSAALRTRRGLTGFR